MMSWVLVLVSLSARAAPLDTALLSRFPVGAMPDSAEVLAEMSALAERGGPEHEALLQSIAAHEQGAVKARALRALDAIDARERAALRAAFQRGLPTAADERRWAAEAQGAAPLDRLGPAERGAVAYAGLLTGQAPSGLRPAPLALLAVDAQAVAEADARAYERAGAMTEAVGRYAQAAASGSAAAREALRELGIDADRLLLGLSSAVGPQLAADDSSNLVEDGGDKAILALLDRARSGGAVARLAALHNLARLVDQGRVSPRLAAEAAVLLELARVDPDPHVRRAAPALAGLPGAEPDRRAVEPAVELAPVSGRQR